MNCDYDAIVIGGGHNGLVAAAYLAKSGQRTLVLEQAEQVGGAAGSEQAFPGFTMDTGAHDAGGFRAEIISELDLARYGLTFLHPPTHLMALLPQGDHLALWRDQAKAQEAIRRFSHKDAERYPDFLAAVGRIRGVLELMSSLTPPTLDSSIRFGEVYPWLRLALRARRLGKREVMDLVRAIPMTVQEYLQEWFESDALQGCLASAGVVGSMQGPLASGTAYMMFYAGIPDGPFRSGRLPKGGMGRLSDALQRAASRYGAEVRTQARVKRVHVEDGRAVGVSLEDGQELRAGVVLSSADPRTTLMALVGAPELEVRVVRRVRNIRFRGSTAKINLAISRLPRFNGDPQPEALQGHILICPSIEYAERAYDDAKYGRYSGAPILDITIPTLLDPSRAPEGQHILSINMQYAPFALRDSAWMEQRERLGDTVVSALAEYAADLPDLILHRQVITPLDMESRYGLPEGSIFHGQMGLDQLLFMRPIPGFGSYRSPIEGLFFCGSGAHPGGGVTGAPGRNAAGEALKALRRMR